MLRGAENHKETTGGAKILAIREDARPKPGVIKTQARCDLGFSFSVSQPLS